MINKLPTIKFSQLLASVREDLHKYDSEGLIDPIRLIKVVRRCNDVLGSPIYDRKVCMSEVSGYKANLPLDFYKMEMVFAVGEFKSYTSLIATGNHYEWTGVQNTCRCQGGIHTCVMPLEQLQPVMAQKTIKPLKLTDRSVKYLSKNSPNRHWFNGLYTIDIQEDVINTEFEEGVLYISYLSDLTDPDTGEILIPFHGKLNAYYEWSVKVKILEDLLFNSEAEVQGLLQYAKNEANVAFSEAVDFVMGRNYRQWSEMRKKDEWEFYKKYYKMFY